MSLSEGNYKFVGFGDIHGPKPYKFIGFGDIHGPKPYKFIRFGDIHGPKKCGSGPENGHEMVLELVSGANFGVRSAPFFEPDPIEGVSGPRSAGNQPKTRNKNYNFYYLF